MTKNVDDIWAKLKASAAPRKVSRVSERAQAETTSTMADTGTSTLPKHSSKTVDGVDTAGRSVVVHANARSDVASYQACIQRTINCLTDLDRSTRKRAIGEIYKTLKCPETKPSAETLQALVVGALHQPLVAMLSDIVEKCRETALALLFAASLEMTDFTPLLPGTVSSIMQRMGVGQPTAAEPSEEIRLQIMKFTTQTLVPCSVSVGDAYCKDISAICIKGLTDSYHEVRNAACTALVSLATVTPQASLQPTIPSIIDPLISCFYHPHSRVRSTSLDALRALIQYSPPPTETITSTVVPALKHLILDKIPATRQSVIETVSIWLGVPTAPPTPHLSPTTYTPPLLPILILGITDSDPEIARRALTTTEHVGDAYCARNLTPPLDAHPAQPPTSVPSDTNDAIAAYAAARLPAPFDRRASLAARTLVASELHLILPPVIREIREWTASLRVTASRCLYGMVALAEGAVLPHLPTLLPALATTVGDEEEVVALRIIRVAHVIAAFCEVKHWLTLLLDHVRSNKSAPSNLTSILVILSAFIHSAALAHRSIEPDNLRSLAAWLSSEEIQAADHAPLRRQLVMVSSNLIELAGEGIGPVAEPLFHVLLHLQGSEMDSYVAEHVEQAKVKLAHACGMSSPRDLAATHAATLLATLLHRCSTWSSTHPDIPTFCSLLRTCPGVTLAALGEPLCLAMASITADHDRDSALRVTLLRLCDSILENDEQGSGLCGPWAMHVLTTVLLPPLVWRAGKSAAAVRFDALTGVCTMFVKRRISAEALAPLLGPKGQLVALLIQSMDEDWYVDTRRCGCFALEHLIRVAGCKFDDSARRQIYPELNKRMDDSSNEVRIATAATIVAFAEDGIPESYCDTNSGYFVSALLVHMDDGNPGVQAAVQAAVIALGRKKGKVVKVEIGKVYEHFKFKFLLDQVLEQLS